MGDNHNEHRIMLGEPSVLEELDEAHFGRRMHHKGRIDKGNWIFGNVGRFDKTMTFFEIVEHKDEKTQCDAIIAKFFP